MQKAEGRMRKAASRITFHVSRSTPHVSRSRQAFTMIEIAISLAIIGFALVAIIGVLPYGMSVQKDNREETIINQDSTIFLNAIRNGAMGMDDLTNYVMAITNEVTRYNNGAVKGTTVKYGYTLTNSSMSPQFPLINGFRIVGLLSTPKYVPLPLARPPGFLSNNVVAYVRSMSGPADEKFPQNNQSMQDLAFSYRMTSEVVPYGTNYYDPGWTNYAAFPANSPENVARYNYSMLTSNLQANIHDLRLLFRWPLRSQGKSGQSAQSFRTLVGGSLQEMNEFGFARQDPLTPSPYDLYFFQPRTYVKAP
jgi:type II secretory pathway pseudopilin PulG